MKLVYIHSESDVEIVAELTVNHSISIEQALELAEVDMDLYAEEQGWDDWDFQALELRV